MMDFAGPAFDGSALVALFIIGLVLAFLIAGLVAFVKYIAS